MGQALRRASGRIRATTLDKPSPPLSSAKKPHPHPPTSNSAAVESTTINAENVLEEKDPQFDAMLGKMVGRISTKAGGKLEMGEAAVVEKYQRPMPKLRNTTPDSTRYEERPAPSGTLNVAQLRHVILLHQGKSNDYSGPMEIPQIAKKFNVDVIQIQKILGSVSLPENNSNKQEVSR